MRWPREYVDLVLRFTNRVVELGDIAVSEALVDWTPLYLNFDLGRSFDPADPTWQEFLEGYEAAEDPVAWTHSFYLAHVREYPESLYGCFSYHYESDSRSIRLHFGNRDVSGHGPLRQERLGERLRELIAMFGDVRSKLPEAQFVHGRSWMYNLPSYRRLFPPEYLRAAEPVEAELQFMSLWGQFLDHGWHLQAGRAHAFLQAIAAASTPDELIGSFPMPVRALRSDIAHFYASYGID